MMVRSSDSAPKLIEPPSNKRTSPYCTAVKHRIVYTKRFVLVILLLFLLVPILYLVPCSTTKIKLNISSTMTFDPFMVSSYSLNSSSYHNITISPSKNTSQSLYWHIVSMELYCSSFSPSLNNTEMMQWVIFNQIKGNNSFYRINTLKVPLFQTNELYQFGNEITVSYWNLNGFVMTYDAPVDYVMSYLKIGVISDGNDHEQFMVNFYHFFQEEPKRNDLKLRVTSEIKIENLTFNAEGFMQYNRWVIDPMQIPSIYPYLISTSIRRYNGLSTLFGVDSI